MTLAEIGQLLREGRQRKGLTLHDVQRATKIRMKYLEAIESGNDEALPPEVYTKGFIRAYANLVNLDGLELARAYSRWKRAQGSRDAPNTEAGTPRDDHGTGEPAWTEGSTADGSVPAEQDTDLGGGRAAGPGGRSGGSELRVGPQASEPLAEEPWESPAASPQTPWAWERRDQSWGPKRPAGRAGEPTPPPDPPLITPLAPRVRRRRGGPTTGFGARRGHARRWGMVGGIVLALILVVAAGLYVMGAPDTPSEAPRRPPEGTGAEGPQPGPASPGGSPAGSAEPESPVQPAGVQVAVQREGDDLHYTITRTGGGGPAGGTGGEADQPLAALPVRLSATDRVWVRVRSPEGEVLYERLMVEGDRHELPLGEGLRLRVGYPRGLTLEVGSTVVEIPEEESPLNLWLEPVETPTAAATVGS